MGKRDNVKVAKRSRDTQEMSDDKLNKASLRKAKKKERAAGKKEALKPYGKGLYITYDRD